MLIKFEISTEVIKQLSQPANFAEIIYPIKSALVIKEIDTKGDSLLDLIINVFRLFLHVRSLISF